MSRHWKEALDPQKHRDHMSSANLGGRPPDAPRDNLLRPWVYFVEVCSFTFQFQSLEQVRDCLEYFQIKVHPSDRMPNDGLEHYWQPWYQRLPQRLFEESKREKVVHALQHALAEFMAGKGERVAAGARSSAR